MDKYMIVFKDKVSKEVLNKYNCKNVEELKHMKRLCICEMESDHAKNMSEDESVLSVELDGADSIDNSEEDLRHETSRTSYAFDLMNIKEFHKKGITGKGFKVGVLDTGVQKHENLNIAGGVNAYDSSKPYDEDLVSSHGTRVAGIISSQGKNNEILGIAPDAELYAIRIDDGKGGINRTIWSSQIKGMNWAIENGMDAVNCSFSSTSESQSRREAFEAAHNAGIAIFCSAGNTQPSGDEKSYNVVFPSKYPFVNTCANITDKKERYYSSSIGRNINFANGGTLIPSTTIDKNNKISKNYNKGTGTSYASPATLGIYILYKQMYQESREKTLQRMSVNAEYLGDSKEYGVGLPKYPVNNYENVEIGG